MNDKKPSRRDQKQAVRAVHATFFSDLKPDQEALRAARVRGLCPCEFVWNVPLWELVIAACADPSPLVRMEALHVIEDAWEHGLPTGRALRHLYQAQTDEDAAVRARAHELVHMVIPKHRQRHRLYHLRRFAGASEPE